MTHPRSTGLSPLPFILAGIAALMGCLLIGVAAWVLLGQGASIADAPTSTPAPIRTLSIPTATIAPTQAPTLTATATIVEPTATTETTEAPTATSIPPTSAPAATNPPRPTNTPVPPTQTPAPADNRLINVSFSVESPTIGINQKIWFNFSVTNGNSLQALPIGELGVVIFNSAGQNVFFQESWSGFELQPGQVLNHRDGMSGIGTPGTYTFRLSVCYSPKSECSTGGDWVLLAQPVAVTVQ